MTTITFKPKVLLLLSPSPLIITVLRREAMLLIFNLELEPTTTLQKIIKIMPIRRLPILAWKNKKLETLEVRIFSWDFPRKFKILFPKHKPNMGKNPCSFSRQSPPRDRILI
jgi:hypothetical protein